MRLGQCPSIWSFFFLEGIPKKYFLLPRRGRIILHICLVDLNSHYLYEEKLLLWSQIVNESELECQ